MSRTYCVCIKNDNYQTSLEPRKIYEVLPDEQAFEKKLLRIVDESGEDYLYPEEYFIKIQLPDQAMKAFVETTDNQ